MLSTNVTALRKNLFAILEQTVKFNQQVNVTTKDGNAVIMSQDDYNSLMETLYLSSIPAMKEKIIEGLKTPIEECIPEDNAPW